MVRTQIQMQEDQINWLRVEASARGVSVSQLIREGIALFRAREERFPEEKRSEPLRQSVDSRQISLMFPSGMTTTWQRLS